MAISRNRFGSTDSKQETTDYGPTGAQRPPSPRSGGGGVTVGMGGGGMGADHASGGVGGPPGPPAQSYCGILSVSGQLRVGRQRRGRSRKTVCWLLALGPSSSSGPTRRGPAAFHKAFFVTGKTPPPFPSARVRGGNSHVALRKGVKVEMTSRINSRDEMRGGAPVPRAIRSGKMQRGVVGDGRSPAKCEKFGGGRFVNPSATHD
ncbi:hypothetical protein AAG570_004422 [Ranatra chinensis]|uniref:Uncharacterized protein n=1 Tax=Ranatra chinensis TaxID=642074 RepID=A0ABD0YJ10_9HEMI